MSPRYGNWRGSQPRRPHWSALSCLPLSTTNVPRDEIIFAVLTPPISLQSCNDDTVLNMGEYRGAMFSRPRKFASLIGLLFTTPIK